MRTAVLEASESGRGGRLPFRDRMATKPTRPCVKASAIQEKLRMNSPRSAHSRTVTPPTSTTLYISHPPNKVRALIPRKMMLRAIQGGLLAAGSDQDRLCRLFQATSDWTGIGIGASGGIAAS